MTGDCRLDGYSGVISNALSASQSSVTTRRACIPLPESLVRSSARGRSRIFLTGCFANRVWTVV